MKIKLIPLAALLVVASFITSCANAPATDTTTEKKFDRTKSSMYAR